MPGTTDMQVAGFTVAVVKPQCPSGPAHGVGCSAMIGPDGEPMLAITIVHRDGTALTAMLDEAELDRLAGMMAVFVEGLPRPPSEARH